MRGGLNSAMLAKMSEPTAPDEAPISTYERIREAATQLFADKGFAAVGIRDIATRAQIATSVIYHYVPNKDELLADIMRIGLRSLVHSATAAVAGRSDPVEQLAALIVNHMTIEVAQSESSSVVDHDFRLLEGALRDEILAIRDQYERLWDDVLDAGARAGMFEIPDPRLVRLFLIDLCDGVRRWYRPDGRLPLESVLASAVDLIFNAVKAQRDGVSVTFASATDWQPGYVSEFIASFDDAARAGRTARASASK